jgi:hypothetical protein
VLPRGGEAIKRHKTLNCAKGLQVQKKFWLRSSGLRFEKLSKDVSIKGCGHYCAFMMMEGDGSSDQNQRFDGEKLAESLQA